MKQQSSVQLVGWIVWWLENVLIIGGMIVMGITRLFTVNLTGTMIGGGMMMGPSHWMVGLGMLAGIAVLIWKIILQVVAYYAIQRLNDVENLTWPIVLIVLGFLGASAYLIPGIWGIIVYYQQNNHR
ncbi:hypothetical protein [Secundilactobacillus silagei]|uniref:Integral membrane protein n=1 Tax=Secundilactobacillus silagei JCM 19001 TaxID=1302250 RepID=A0A1Z5IG08_9LACO|nr:hypothetical protein [Secundilactobacillus silagei]TDG73354.1 hypothetical protein C5L25_000503 [Secundilactobacillus silagei JCM 19001]GAX00725.1 hypothetical protein IWT126_00740 [Secundilactobacillus silagei JCM 19001]